MGDHARLSPSAAHRWMSCPGSVKLSEQVPQDTGTDYTREGTEAHELAELKLSEAPSKILDYKKKSFDFYSGEMDESTDFYKDVVLEALTAAGEDATLSVEQKFSLEKWVPEGFGYADAVITSGKTISVFDLKYGKGVKIDAKNNPQLRLYGLGAAELFSCIYDFDTVKMTIIQPRLDHVSTEELPLEELKKWAENQVAPAAQLALSDDSTDHITCGEWCRFCPAKAICRKRAEANLDLARMEFKQAPLLSNEEIGEVLAQAEELKKWAEDIAAYALDQALDGKAFTGWKLVEGRSVRKYADEVKVAEALKAAGFDEAVLYERKLNGITAMEKIVGKKKLTELLGDLLIKPAGKPALVPESDKREAINTAKSDFSN